MCDFFVLLILSVVYELMIITSFRSVIIAAGRTSLGVPYNHILGFCIRRDGHSGRTEKAPEGKKGCVRGTGSW